MTMSVRGAVFIQLLVGLRLVWDRYTHLHSL